MTAERIRYLFERFFTGSCDDGERLEFLHLVEGDEHDEELLGVMEECWERYAPEAGNAAGVRNELSAPGAGRGRGMFGFWRVAAVVLLLIAGAFLLWGKRAEEVSVAKVEKPANVVSPIGQKAVLTLTGGQTIVLDSAGNGRLARQGAVDVMKMANGQLSYRGHDDGGGSQYNTISTPRGGQYEVVLTDGTKVWLDAASSLSYPTVFKGLQREVSLTGEAYFEVAADAEKPFLVRVGGEEVQVLGTSFNIMAYTEEGAVRTSLLEGAVRVRAGKNNPLLKPGQQAVWDRMGGMDVIDDADLDAAVAWKNGLLQFNSADIRQVMRQIARWYDVVVEYAPDVKEEHFTGSVPSQASLKEVLTMLEMTNTIKFEVEGRVIRVKKK